MDEKELKSIAKQLRKPSGTEGIEVGEKMNEGNLQINLDTIEALDLKAGDRMLEIGMGNGYFVKNILSINNSIKYYGCDYSDLMVDQAKQLNKEYIKTQQAEFYQANANQLPFEDQYFNKVFSINTIYFWDRPLNVLNEISRVLKPEGQVTISLRPKSVLQYFPFIKYGFRLYSKYDLLDLLTQSNFKVLKIVENAEPDFELNGVRTKTASLIISAEKRVLKMA